MLTALCLGVWVVAYCGGVFQVFAAGCTDEPGLGFARLAGGVVRLLVACLAAAGAVAVNH